MDRGAWQVTVQGVAESDMTKIEHSNTLTAGSYSLIFLSLMVRTRKWGQELYPLPHIELL